MYHFSECSADLLSSPAGIGLSSDYIFHLLLFYVGRMLHSTGKDTKGRGARSDLRRNIVISFLAGCREDEIGILLDLITEPFTPLLSPGMWR